MKQLNFSTSEAGKLSNKNVLVSIITILNRIPIIFPTLLFVIMFIIMSILMGDAFSINLLTSILQTTLPLIIVGFGQTLVILIGGIDLAVGGIMSLATAIIATQMTEGSDMILWMPIVPLLGLLIGLLNGYVIEKTKIQPFIVTLATWSILSGLALKILPTQGGAVAPPLINFVYDSFLGINISFWITLVLILFWLIIKRLRFGLSILALGSNENAAKLNGQNTGITKILVFGVSGLFAAISGIYFSALTDSGSSIAGDPFIMRSVASVVIGGTSLSGGRGSYLGTVLGALILSFIRQIIFFAGAQSAFSQLFEGGLLIVAMLIYSGIMLFAERTQFEK